MRSFRTGKARRRELDRLHGNPPSSARPVRSGNIVVVGVVKPGGARRLRVKSPVRAFAIR